MKDIIRYNYMVQHLEQDSCRQSNGDFEYESKGYSTVDFRISNGIDGRPDQLGQDQSATRPIKARSSNLPTVNVS